MARIPNYYDSEDDWYFGDVSPSKPIIKEKQIEPKQMDSKLKLEVEYTNKSNAYGHSRIIKITKDRSTLFRADVIPFPECCGICIFKNVATSDIPRVEFTECMRMIIQHLQENDMFSMALIYHNDRSNVTKQLSRFEGAVHTGLFKNRRSGNMLTGFEINLDPNRSKHYIGGDDEEEREDEELELIEEDDEEGEAQNPEHLPYTSHLDEY